MQKLTYKLIHMAAINKEEFMTVLTHFLAFLAGGVFGIAIMCIAQAAGKSEKQ